MIKYLSLIFIFVLPHIALEKNSIAHDDKYRALAPILSSAERFFISLKDGEYAAAWDLLSEDSRKTIISDVYEVTRKINGNINREDIINDFAGRGSMFTNYWKSFQRSFDADMILEQSEWEMGTVRNDEAEIIITYNNSEGPAILKMRKENASWKVGLAETFWQRKSMNILHIIFQ